MAQTAKTRGKRTPPTKPTKTELPTDHESLAALRHEIQTDVAANGVNRVGAAQGTATGAGRGLKYRKLPDGTLVATEDIVEFVRTLLIDCWTDGDIKRALVKKFGGKGCTFKKHISLARKSNLQVLERTPEQAKSESIGQWVRLLAEAKSQKSVNMVDLRRGQRLIAAIQKKVDDGEATAHDFKQFDEAQNLADLYLERVKYWSSQVVLHQDRVDRLFGSHAPLAIKSDTGSVKAEVSMNLDAYPEPLTHQECDEQLMALFDKVMQMQKDAEPDAS